MLNASNQAKQRHTWEPGQGRRTYKSHRPEETQQFGQSLEVLGAALLGPDLRKLFQGPG